jgi:hypothetical protein
LRRVKAGSRDAWDLTTRTNSAGWGPSFTGLWEYGHIRPLHQLGNTEQAMVVSTPFKDNAGRPRVFYAMLRRLEGRWLIARHGYDAAESVSSLMQGFSTNPGMAFDVQSEELVGHWLGACLEFSLTADGQGRWIVTGPEGPLPEPKPFRWAVSGSTLWFQNAEGVRKAEVTWVENDTFHFRYTDGEAQGVWRTESKEAQDPPPAR